MRARPAALLLALAAPLAVAQEVVVTGSNTARVERYDTSGDRNFTPYPTTTTTGFDALSLEANWKARDHPYDKWKATIDAVLNDSPYRSSERGLVPERLAIVREYGYGAIPYRLEAGDFYGYTTNRTLQRPLKGAALDLQPGEGRQSILLYAGAFQSSWRDFRWRDDNSVGLSWLSALERANVSVNLLRNERSPEVEGVADRRTQQVASLSANGTFDSWTDRSWAKGWRWEAEIAGLRGDHEDLGDGGRDKRDTGYFVQIARQQVANTFDARVRAERYGKDFRPFSANVTPERRSAEAYLGWTSPEGLRYEARAQAFRDGFQSPNPLDTRVVGASAIGQLGPGGASINADFYRQTVERSDASVDQTTLSGRAQVGFKVGAWDTQAGVFMQKIDDAVQPDASPRTHELTLSVTRVYELVAGWKITFTPGVAWRNLTNSSSGHRDLQGTLTLELKRDDVQRLRLVANRLGLEPRIAGGVDVATVDLGLEYRHRFGQHELGIDYTGFQRRPETGESTRAYRAGVQWIYYFDKPPPMYSFGAPLPLLSPNVLFSRDLGVLALPLGVELDAALARVAESGFGAGTPQGSAFVYEARLLPEVDGRQRLVIAHEAGRVDRVALIVSLAPGGAPTDAGRTYDAVMRAMIQQFGRPSATREEGTFGPAFANDLAMGRLARVAEWRLADGVLRVGIPRRLDGVARVEIQHARTLGSLRDSSWSLESIR